MSSGLDLSLSVFDSIITLCKDFKNRKPWSGHSVSFYACCESVVEEERSFSFNLSLSVSQLMAAEHRGTQVA